MILTFYSSNSNQLDLRILREMGVDVDARRYADGKILSGRQKFRAGVFAVMAVGRMERMVGCWKRARRVVGESRGCSS